MSDLKVHKDNQTFKSSLSIYIMTIVQQTNIDHYKYHTILTNRHNQSKQQYYLQRYTQKQMSFDRTPKQFMQNVFVAPHSFSDPQHPEHGDYVNMQMKNDLYNDSLYKITACQFSLFAFSGDQQLSVQKMSKCEGPDPLNGLAARFSNKKTDQSQLISCQDWKILRTSGQSHHGITSNYRVKIYQTKSDIFYPQIHPPTYWKLFKHYLFG